MAAQDEDDVGDSWEDIEEEDLIRRLTTRQHEIKQQQQNPPEPTHSTPTPVINNERAFIDGPMKIKYSEGSEYVASIKILKRPAEGSASSATSSITERTQKSYAEREAEYASARARILGNAVTPNNIKAPPSDKKILHRQTSNNK